MRRFTALACLFAISAHAGQSEQQRPRLRGLKGVCLAVFVNDDAESPAARTLRTRAELKLRSVGITLVHALALSDDLATNEVLASRNYASLGIAARVLTKDTARGPVPVVAVEVALFDHVSLRRAPEISFDAATWECPRTLAFVESVSVLEFISKPITDCMDEFANDYLAANPK